MNLSLRPLIVRLVFITILVLIIMLIVYKLKNINNNNTDQGHGHSRKHKHSSYYPYKGYYNPACNRRLILPEVLRGTSY